MSEQSNKKYEYYCRKCKGRDFRVGWYLAPTDNAGVVYPACWCLECTNCKRVTRLPDEPDLSEATARTPEEIASELHDGSERSETR